MDALSVSIASGAQIKEARLGHAARIAFFFGLFQAVMPLIGAFAGASFKSQISAIDHWIIFFILSFIGGKMIYEAKFLRNSGRDRKDPSSFRILLLLAIATSIDALAVGISLSFLMDINSILHASIIIGAVTFVLCFFGVIAGDYLGHLCEDKTEIAGGLVLIAVGVKILIEHLFQQ